MKKMKEVKNNKGITLIALVITIIVLLILAGVSVAILTGDNAVLDNAQKAKQETAKGQAKEEEDIAATEEYMELIVGKWVQDGLKVTRGKTTLTVGDVVNYDETKNGEITGLKDVEWKVLGAQNGLLLLMSTSNVEDSKTLKGIDGYANGITYLNKICSAYANGTKAQRGRSVNIEDVNKITGYNVNEGKYNSSDGTYTVYGAGTKYEYLNIEYYYGKNFGYFDGNNWVTLESTGESSAPIQSNYYSYFPTTLSSEITDPERGLRTTSEEYKLLLKNADDTDADYYLADQFTRTHEGYVNFGLRAIFEAEVQRSYLVTGGSEGSDSHGVRAVVSLKTEAKLEKDKTTNIWEIK